MQLNCAPGAMNNEMLKAGKTQKRSSSQKLLIPFGLHPILMIAFG
jgi:hypothetical protein